MAHWMWIQMHFNYHKFDCIVLGSIGRGEGLRSARADYAYSKICQQWRQERYWLLVVMPIPLQTEPAWPRGKLDSYTCGGMVPALLLRSCCYYLLLPWSNCWLHSGAAVGSSFMKNLVLPRPGVEPVPPSSQVNTLATEPCGWCINKSVTKQKSCWHTETEDQGGGGGGMGSIAALYRHWYRLHQLHLRRSSQSKDQHLYWRWKST